MLLVSTPFHLQLTCKLGHFMEALLDNPALNAFFASFVSEESLNGLITEKRREDLHLEFKTKKDSRTPELDRDSDSWQFSRALSGFANSDGGIVIWGLECNANSQATALKPISCIENYRDRLQKSLLNSVQPVVDGVLFTTIPAAAVDAAGFLVVLIPQSDKVPHRALLAGREYYKRTTEGFYRLEHFDLEDLFGRRPKPALDLMPRLIQAGTISGGGDTQCVARIVLSIRNVGRGVARSPYLAFHTDPPRPPSGIDGAKTEGLPRLPSVDQSLHIYGGSSAITIIPGVIHEVTGIQVGCSYDHKARLTMPPDLSVFYRLGSEELPLKEGHMTISKEEIARVAFPSAYYADLNP